MLIVIISLFTSIFNFTLPLTFALIVRNPLVKYFRRTTTSNLLVQQIHSVAENQIFKIVYILYIYTEHCIKSVFLFNTTRSGVVELWRALILFEDPRMVRHFLMAQHQSFWSFTLQELRKVLRIKKPDDFEKKGSKCFLLTLPFAIVILTSWLSCK